MSAPAIGICAAIERVSWGVWDGYEVTLAPSNYVSAVQRAGGLAIVLPPDPAAVADPDLLLDRVDGLLMAGGADVDPASYGAEPHPETVGTWPERDAFEIALARRALARDLPLLGICRGMQLLNVALGGSLDQHLGDSIESSVHRSLAGSFGTHRVRLAPGTLACAAAGTEGLLVMSHHHQGVDRLGEGLEVSGWSEGDDLVEAIELPERRFALGVVWHPEEDPESPVIAALVESARGASGRRDDLSSQGRQIGPSASDPGAAA
ncbi:MAG: gamma-glutamyl-gamma-aminobutyrate hydrolase family protein [Solirubrobacterales bacterium]